MTTKSPAPYFWKASIPFLPLLALFITSALLQTSPDTDGDGWRYLMYARNLTQGYFGSPESLMFWNGPGYPLFILPWVALGWSMTWAHLANALVLWMAILYSYATLRLWNCGRHSLAYAYGLGLLLLWHGSSMGAIMSECLSVYFLCGGVWFYASACKQSPTQWFSASSWLAGLHLGGLALTKVFFGYVLETCLVMGLLAWILWRTKPETVHVIRQGILACILALITCLPWLAYTYGQTGKVHLWSNSGGWQWWYMTWPESQYHGDWLNWQAILEYPDYFKPHLSELKTVLQTDVVTQDSILRAWSRENIRKHPMAYFTHWRANVNRMVFGYPITLHAGGGSKLATGNRTFIYALPFFLFAIMAWPMWRARNALPKATWGLLLFASTSLGGTSLLSAIPRQVFPMLPILWLVSCMVAEKGLRVKV